jgi:hypothetical protein
MQTLQITIYPKTQDHWPVAVEFNTGTESLPVRHEGMFGLDSEEVWSVAAQPEPREA